MPKPRLARPGSTPMTRNGESSAWSREAMGLAGLFRGTPEYGSCCERVRPARTTVRRAVPLSYRWGRGSVLGQVAVELPLVHGYAVLVVLLRLGVHQAAVHVIAERVDYDLVALQVTHGLTQVGGQVLDLVLTAVAHAHLVDVAVDGWGWFQAALQPVDTGGRHGGQGQVGVGGGVGHAEFRAGAVAAACGDADHGAAVGHRPGDVGGRLVPGGEALVAVHGGVGDRHHAGRVLQQAAYPVESFVAEFVGALGVVEGVPAVLEDAHVGVHA